MAGWKNLHAKTISLIIVQDIDKIGTLGPRTNCWTSKGFFPRMEPICQESTAKTKSSRPWNSWRSGWLHRQGLIRHRGPAVDAEGLGRLEGERPLAEGNRSRVGEAILQGQDRRGHRRDTRLLFFAQMSAIRTRKHFAFAFSDNGLRNWARKDPRWENRHGILDADSEKARKAFEGKGGREPVPSAATADPRNPRPGPRLRQPSPTSRSSRPKTRRSNG